MKIRVLGGGWYGCSIALGLMADGHDVELWEGTSRLFSGASGANPARLHLGFHYPRSGLTMAACQEHQQEFMERYGFLTRGVPINLYAVADKDSLVDYRQYVDAFRGKVQFIEVDPKDYGLRNVEGAILTGERHIVIDKARKYFTKELGDIIRFCAAPELINDLRYDMTIDCTFCANDDENIDRFEPCVTGIMKGPTIRAVTIMDGPFGSVYPWHEELGLSSLTSAKWTPLSKTVRSYREARHMLDTLTKVEARERVAHMMSDMEHFYPGFCDLYEFEDVRLGIRAMPRSAADTRLVDVIRVGSNALRVRAGKIDAVFHAERVIKDIIHRSRVAQKQEVVG
jgi:hypothetical protein